MILIGRRIKELRNKYKLTQTELAEKLGVTRTAVAAYENDSRLPSYDVLIKMSDIFRVSIDSILLNRFDVVLDAHGLTAEQIDILGIQIAYFRKVNSIEDFFSDASPEARELVKDYLDTKLDDKK